MQIETRTITPVIPPTTEQSPAHSLLLQPAGNTDDIVRSWNNYLDLKSKLLSVTDYQEIAGKRCITKSGWRKLATAFGISDELIKEERREYKDYFVYEITVKASANNGRYSFGTGSCSSNERRFTHPDHDVMATAHTRSKNRAISDLIGGGEVSAEEMAISSDTSLYEHNTPSLSHQNDTPMTEPQRKYLISLISSQVIDRDERERRFEVVDGLSKREASELIKELSMT